MQHLFPSSCRRDARATINKLSLQVFVLVFVCRAALAQEAPSVGRQSAGFSVDSLDSRIDPCTDFYAFACGKWQAQNPVPADRPTWGGFNEHHEGAASTECAIFVNA